MITQTIGTLVQWRSNAIIVNISYIIGVKCDIRGNNLALTKLEHGFELCRCLDPYGEGDLNLIHFTFVVKIKDH
jgi:hypothetical protein